MKSKHRLLYAGMKAVVIEDDSETRRLCRQVLEEHGLAVREANRGVAALAELRKEPPHLIFVGLQLRDVSGFEAVGWIKSYPALSLVPVVAISARGLPEDDPMLRQCGIQDVLRKPVSADAVARTICRLLGAPP